MRKYFYVVLPCILFSCHTAARGPVPESEQVIGEGLKELYMQASAAPPRSPAQQALIRKMADRATNGKELMLAMRAADGVFSGDAGTAPLRAQIAGRMIQLATLDQLSDFAAQYGVDSANARAYVERMLQLGKSVSDPRAWHRIRAVAGRLKLSDLEQQAQARASELTAH
jgi:hypothetical protein